MDTLALDASLASAWCFTDERTPYTEAVLDAVSVKGAVAPRLWSYEVRNSVLMGLRRKRITAAHAQAFLASLNDLPMRLIDPVDFGPVFALAERFGLTVYDAAYVDLALREGLKLATLDQAMRKAAVQAGVELFQP